MKQRQPAHSKPTTAGDKNDARQPAPSQRPIAPLPNYTLSTLCPACDAPTVRRACKVRCERCGFMWDCSEL